MALTVNDKIRLDMARPNTEVLYAKQYDMSSRKVEATLVHAGEAWMVPSGAVGIVRYLKSDRIGGFYDVDENGANAVSVNTTTRNKVTITLAQQMLTTAGRVRVEINFYSASSKLTTFAFTLMVEESTLMDSAVVSSPYYNVLTNIIQTVVSAADKLPTDLAQYTSEWLEENITVTQGVTIDTSLSVSGAAADAKATGDRLSTVENDILTIHSNEAKFDLIPDTYIDGTTAEQRAYNGWSATGFIKCEDWSYLGYNDTALSEYAQYSWFYDKDKVKISKFGIGSSSGRLPYVQVPQNAVYCRISASTADMNALKLTFVTKQEFELTVDSGRLDLISKYETEGYSKVITFGEKDLSFGSPDPNMSETATYRMHTARLPVPNGTAVFKMTDPDYTARVYFYRTENANRSEYTRRTSWGSSVEFTAEPEENYYVIEVANAVENNRYIYHAKLPGILTNLCVCVYGDGSESTVGSAGKYLRVCTFNMARNWTQFQNLSSEEYSKWQIEHFLNLYGEIDPDILGMQEALGPWSSTLQRRLPGHYIDMDDHYLMYDETLKHKFDYMAYLPNDDSRICSKYPISNASRTVYPENIMHPSSRERRFVKSTITIGTKKIAFFNTHIEYRGDFDEYQGPQVDYLCNAMRSALNSDEADYAIATADFNIFDPEAFRAKVESCGFKVANSGKFGDVVTWAWKDYVDSNDLVTDPDNPSGPKIPKYWGLSCCDNIIVSENIEVQQIGAVKLYEPIEESVRQTIRGWPLLDADGNFQSLSDHYPFWADLRLK